MSKEVTTTEIFEFLQENMLTKEDASRFATKDELRALRDEIMGHLDGVIKRLIVFEEELVFMRARLDRHEVHLGLA